MEGFKELFEKIDEVKRKLDCLKKISDKREADAKLVVGNLCVSLEYNDIRHLLHSEYYRLYEEYRNLYDSLPGIYNYISSERLFQENEEKAS